MENGHIKATHSARISSSIAIIRIRRDRRRGVARIGVANMDGVIHNPPNTTNSRPHKGLLSVRDKWALIIMEGTSIKRLPSEKCMAMVFSLSGSY